MGLPMTVPETDKQIKNSQNRKLCYYIGKACEDVELIREKIYEFTPRTVDVYVLPTAVA